MKTTHFFKNTLLTACLAFGSIAAWGATPYAMRDGTYTENFADIGNWGDNFVSGNGAQYWASVPVYQFGALGEGQYITKSTEEFVYSTAGGVQKGDGTIIMLSTSTNNSCAIDLFLDFTGREAGTISFDAATVFNLDDCCRESKLKLFYSTDGTTFTELTEANLPYTAKNSVAGSASITNLALPEAFDNCATASLRFYEQSTGGGSPKNGTQPKISIDNIAVTSTAITGDPTIIVSETALSGFSYAVGHGPSAEKSFTVECFNLTGSNITITPPVNYEISTQTGSSFVATNPVTLNTVSGAISSTTIYVRLKAGLTEGNYNAENISIASSGVTTKTVSCSGSVMDESLTIAPTVLPATNITNNSFTANWEAVSGADGYILSVYKIGAGAGSSTILGKELVDVGNFESGNLENWPQTGKWAISTDYPHTGSYHIRNEVATGSSQKMEKEIAVTEGSNYIFSFWYNNYDATAFDGLKNFTLSDIETHVYPDPQAYIEQPKPLKLPAASVWTKYEKAFTATGPVMRISIRAYQSCDVDDVSIKETIEGIPVAGSPFTINDGEATSYVVNGLETGASYVYTVQSFSQGISLPLPVSTGEKVKNQFINVTPASVSAQLTSIYTPVNFSEIEVSGKELIDDIIVAITGADAAMFKVSADTLDYNSTTPLTVTYLPTAGGTHNAVLEFTSTRAEKKTITLAGTAIDMGLNTISMGTPYYQDFDLMGEAANRPLPTGWKVERYLDFLRTVSTAYPDVTQTKLRYSHVYNNPVGSSSLGEYNFGGDSQTDRAIGGGNEIYPRSLNYFFQLKNAGSAGIGSFNIAYDAERYRNATNPTGTSIRVYYSTTGAKDSWTEVSGLIASFAPNANNNGSAMNPIETIPVSGTLDQMLAAGDTIYLAWSISTTSGDVVTDKTHPLAIDNVLITAVPAVSVISVDPETIPVLSTVVGVPVVSGEIAVSNTNHSEIGVTVTGTDAALFTPSKTVVNGEGTSILPETLTVTYSPTTAGSHTATLEFTSEGAFKVSVPLSGSALGTSLDDATLAGIKVIAGKGYVKIDLPESARIEVINTQGVKVRDIQGNSGINDFSLPTGLYIVKVEGKVVKVVVQ